MIRGKNNKARVIQRVQDAAKRRIVYEKLSDSEKLELISKRRGSSKKETARILKSIEKSKVRINGNTNESKES
jgi:hypothetical protein